MDVRSKTRRKSCIINCKRPASRLNFCLMVLKDLIRCVLQYVCAIRYLNPVYLIQEKQKKLYYFDKKENILIQPKLWERIFNLISTDTVRRGRILRWVQKTLPDHSVDDFSHSWNNGIVLCALLEAVHPGICPSFNHLKQHNRVNNCRLGLKLAQQCFHLPLDIISPEEMAIADASVETVLLKYVSMLKWASEKSRSCRRYKNVDKEHPVKMTSFTVKGSGIASGVVGKKARFSLSVTDVMGMFHLGIDIKGPKNEEYSEQIISLHQSKEIMIGTYHTQPQKGRFASIDNHVMEYMEDGVGNTYVRWKNLKLLGDSCSISVIPFNCQCTGEDTFLMTYLPISTGIHTISIKWQNVHIEGSPFKIKVYQPRDLTRRAIRDAKDKRIIFDSLSLSSIEERPQGLLKIDDNIFNCRSKNNSEMSSNKSQRTSRIKKQFTVTKRRVIRKVISRHGEEIVIQESPSPSLSRQSSMTDTSTEEEQFKKSCMSSSPFKRKNLSRSASVCTEVTQSGDSDRDENNKNRTLNSPNHRKTGQNDIISMTLNTQEPAKCFVEATCKRSFSDSALNYSVNLDKIPTYSCDQNHRSNDVRCKGFQTNISFLKGLQSNSLKKSCYFSSDFQNQRSFSSTSSASSNSNSSTRKIKNCISLSRSLPILNGVYPYNKKMSRLERIRKDRRYAIDIHLKSEKLSTSLASPSTSSLSSLATPSTSIPFDDTKRSKDKVYDDAMTHPCGRRQTTDDSDKCQVKGMRGWEQSMSKHRATTMYWLNNQTTDHFSIDSTDSDPNFLVEQSILGPEETQSSNEVWKNYTHNKCPLLENVLSIDSKESALSKKIGLQRQYSEMKDLESCINKACSKMKNQCDYLEKEERNVAREPKSSSQLSPVLFKSIVTVSNIVPSKVHVVTPKVKVNKTTQVSVNEILHQSNIFNILSNLKVKKRKQYLNIGKENENEIDKTVSRRDRSLSEGAICGNYSRQSTIDSGIAEENQCKPFKISKQNVFPQTVLRTKHNKPYQSRKRYVNVNHVHNGIKQENAKRPTNLTRYHRRREMLPTSFSSFSDSEITTRRAQVHSKKIFHDLPLYQSECSKKYSVNSTIFSKEENIKNSKAKNLSESIEDFEVENRQSLLSNSEKEMPSSKIFNLGIGIPLINQNNVFHHRQTFMSESCGKNVPKTNENNSSQKRENSKAKHRVFYSGKKFNITNSPRCCFMSAFCNFVSPSKKMFANSLVIQLKDSEDLETASPKSLTLDDVSLKECNAQLGSTVNESNEICTAEGVGLSRGQVGVKNNFQVWCHSQRNLAVSVTIHGPRPFSVIESSVTYTGDNLYEVTYDVAYPGYYVICIKCGNDTIPNSPFLSKVTY